MNNCSYTTQNEYICRNNSVNVGNDQMEHFGILGDVWSTVKEVVMEPVTIAEDVVKVAIITIKDIAGHKSTGQIVHDICPIVVNRAVKTAISKGVGEMCDAILPEITEECIPVAEEMSPIVCPILDYAIHTGCEEAIENIIEEDLVSSDKITSVLCDNAIPPSYWECSGGPRNGNTYAYYKSSGCGSGQIAINSEGKCVTDKHPNMSNANKTCNDGCIGSGSCTPVY